MGIEHALGAVIGAFVGDACGASLEFAGSISEAGVEHAMTLPGGGVLRMGPGQITDDSELAMCQINALKSRHPIEGFPGQDLLDWYHRWFMSNPFDYGTTTSNALHPNYTMTYEDHISRVGEVNKTSKSNGSMMRATPLCVWIRNLELDKRAEFMKADSALTHPNPSVLDACAIYGIGVSTLVTTNGDKDSAITNMSNWSIQNAHPEVQSWLKQSTSVDLSQFKVQDQAGFVKWGFILALYFLRNETSYQDAIQQTLLLGGDTDTNAAIVGGMIGAFHGVTGIPQNLRHKMINYKYDKSAKVGYLRPDDFQPNQIEELITDLYHNSE